MNARLIFCFLLLLLGSSLQAQEEYLLGKSANTLKKGKAIFSGEYSVFAFENIRSRRLGMDISVGVTDKLQLSARGSFSEFPNTEFGFETIGLTLLYQLSTLDFDDKRWVIAPFLQLGGRSNLGPSPGDINFDGNNSGFAVGMVANRNKEDVTFSYSVAYSRISMPQFASGLLNGYAILYTASMNKDLNISASPQLKTALIVELIGQFNTEMEKISNVFFRSGSYIDALGGLQVTYADRYRVELGLQTQLTGNVMRFADSLYHIRLKYLL